MTLPSWSASLGDDGPRSVWRAPPPCALPARRDGEPVRPPELIEAARREATLVYYTANFTESSRRSSRLQQALPVRAGRDDPRAGRPVITRVKTEAAAGQARADIANHRPRLIARALDLFQDYAPPNAADYIADVLVSPNCGRRATSLVRSPTIPS